MCADPVRQTRGQGEDTVKTEDGRALFRTRPSMTKQADRSVDGVLKALAGLELELI